LTRRVLRALRERWPASGGVLTGGALLAYPVERGGVPAPRRVSRPLESLQQRGSPHPSRANPAHVLREAHGARSIVRLNLVLLDEGCGDMSGGTGPESRLCWLPSSSDAIDWDEGGHAARR
jgi:hypothetical protein